MFLSLSKERARLTSTFSEAPIAKTPTAASIFDAHHPPSRELVDDCVHCGFCLPSCPTYVLWGEEADSPRGRIYLMRAGLDGRAAWSDGYRRHFDTCLGCMACLTACPSGVQYDRLIEATRPQVERHRTRSPGDRLFRAIIFALFPYPTRLRMAARLLWLYQRSGLRRLVHASGLMRLMPARLAAMERLLPAIDATAFRSATPTREPARGTARMRVGLLLGCVQRVFFAGVNDATVRVLAAEGCDVEMPGDQGCCGALALHAGRDDEASAAARRLIEVFERANVDRIVINAAGCGSAVKSYGDLLRDDAAYAERARAFASKCVDVSELLATLEPRATRHPLPMRVAYHDACHLQHAQRVRQQPRDVLRTIPGLEICEIAEPEMCCGSAGIYNLLEPATANTLGARKVGHVAATGAEALVSSNPGCLMQIASGLAAAGRSMPTLHLVELLDRSICNSPP